MISQAYPAPVRRFIFNTFARTGHEKPLVGFSGLVQIILLNVRQRELENACTVVPMARL